MSGAISNWKEFLRLITPPFLFALYDKSRRLTSPRSHKIVGYENETLVRHVVEKTAEFRSNVSDSTTSTSLMIGVSLLPLIKSDSLRILDFGGASGAHYFQMKHVVQDLEFDWRIVETEKMCTLARKRFGDSDSHLGFYESVARASEDFTLDFDIVIAASSLGYTDNPHESLNQLLKLKPRVLLITRQVLTEGSSIRLNQRSVLNANGPKTTGSKSSFGSQEQVEYFLTIPNRAQFESAILSSGYHFLARFQDQPSVMRSGTKLLNSWCFLATSQINPKGVLREDERRMRDLNPR
jgi:putative methyltransferase (TIGR04325 family)